MVERTHTREIQTEKSQKEKFVEKTKEHSSRRFVELPGRALDHTDHAEGGPYIAEEDCTATVQLSYGRCIVDVIPIRIRTVRSYC